MAEGGPADFSVEESEFQGLRVLRWTHRLEHRMFYEGAMLKRLKNMFFGPGLVNHQGQIQHANHQFCRLLGYDQTQMEELSIEQLLPVE